MAFEIINFYAVSFTLSCNTLHFVYYKGFSNAYIGWKSSIEGHGLQRATPVQRALSAKGVSASVVSRVQGQLDKLAQLFRQVGQSD